MAVLLQEYSAEPVDLLKVIKMVLLHDLVEIVPATLSATDPEAGLDKKSELKAAGVCMGSCPDQGGELRALWDEFEAGKARRPSLPSV